MIDAWLSSSLIRASSSVRRHPNSPPLAFQQDVYVMEASVSRKQFAMDVPRSTDEAYGCGARPISGSSIAHRFDHLGDVAQAHVVVRAQVHGLAELFELHDRSLHSHDMEEALVNALFLHSGQLADQSAVQAFVYGAPRYVRFLVEDHLTPPHIQSSL
jgi:hypothetical protein